MSDPYKIISELATELSAANARVEQAKRDVQEAQYAASVEEGRLRLEIECLERDAHETVTAQGMRASHQEAILEDTIRRLRKERAHWQDKNAELESRLRKAEKKRGAR